MTRSWRYTEGVPDLRVALTDADRAQVKTFLAQLKTQSKQDALRSRMTEVERDGAECAGKLAEVAVGRCFGWPVDWSVHRGGDGHVDFTLRDGSTVDVKAVCVTANMDYDFHLAVSAVIAAYFVQVLVPQTLDSALITGGISRARFLALAVPKTDWTARGSTVPWVVPRSALRHAYPAIFWPTSTCVGV